MKRIISIVLVLLICLGCLCGCGDVSSTSNTNTESTTRRIISTDEAMNAAKQGCVNEICKRKGVQKINIIYGTEEIEGGYRHPDGNVEVYYIHLKGQYRAMDSYGNLGNSSTFVYAAIVNPFTGELDMSQLDKC